MKQDNTTYINGIPFVDSAVRGNAVEHALAAYAVECGYKVNYDFERNHTETGAPDLCIYYGENNRKRFYIEIKTGACNLASKANGLASAEYFRGSRRVLYVPIVSNDALTVSADGTVTADLEALDGFYFEQKRAFVRAAKASGLVDERKSTNAYRAGEEWANFSILTFYSHKQEKFMRAKKYAALMDECRAECACLLSDLLEALQDGTLDELA